MKHKFLIVFLCAFFFMILFISFSQFINKASAATQSAPINPNQVTVTNNNGNSDTVKIVGLKNGDDVRIYSANGQSLTARKSSGWATMLYIKQLGKGSGYIYVTVKHPNLQESLKLQVPYISEPQKIQSNSLQVDQVTVNNNYGKEDTIKIIGIDPGDDIRIYNSNAQSLTARKSSGSATMLYIKQLGSESGAIYLTITKENRSESIMIPINYLSESRSPQLSNKQVSVINNFGKTDLIKVTDIHEGDDIRIYNSKGQSLTARKSSGTATMLYINQLGIEQGTIYLTIKHPNSLESYKTPIYYSAEPKTTPLESGQVEISNNYGAADQIKVTGLHNGDDVRLYNSKVQSVTARKSSGWATMLYVNQLGNGPGSIYITVKRTDQHESSKLKVNYGAEQTSSPLKASQVVVTNNSWINDTIKVTGIQNGDDIRVYNENGQSLTARKSAGSATMLYVDQLGNESGKIYVTIKHPNMVESAMTAVYYYAQTVKIDKLMSTYAYTLNSAVDKQMKVSPVSDRSGVWDKAERSDVQQAMNPDQFLLGTSEYYQFLDLSNPAIINNDDINNNILNNSGALKGKALYFSQASQASSINEIYLISHAQLETGNGTSSLANGIKVTSVDGKSVTPKMVYNVFGIGATDLNPNKYGAEFAYKQGWFTIEDAIRGGAAFIGSNYIYKDQDTLYKMRWNPANPATHQYATDIEWAIKQTYTINKLYNLLTNYSLSFNVPLYY